MLYIILAIYTICGVRLFGADLPDIGDPIRSSMNVSMISLIANPEKYLDKQVRFNGFLKKSFDDTWYIFYSEAHAKMFDLANAISLNSTSKKVEIPESFNSRYVRIEGIFFYSEVEPQIQDIVCDRFMKTINRISIGPASPVQELEIRMRMQQAKSHENQRNNDPKKTQSKSAKEQPKKSEPSKTGK